MAQRMPGERELNAATKAQERGSRREQELSGKNRMGTSWGNGTVAGRIKRRGGRDVSE